MFSGSQPLGEDAYLADILTGLIPSPHALSP